MILRKFPRHVLIILLITAVFLTACNAAGTAPSPTPDVNALNTAIVGTTIAQFSDQFTQTALAAPTNTTIPTNTPLPLPTFEAPTNTGALPTFSLESPTPASAVSPLPGLTQLPSPVPAGATQPTGDSCFNSVFELDVTIPDGTVVKGGESLKKTWKIRNTGTCTWDEGFRLVHIGGNIPNDNFASQYFEFQSKDSVAGGEAINLTVGFNAPCAAGQYEAHWKMQNDGGYYFGTILSVYIETKGKTGGC